MFCLCHVIWSCLNILWYAIVIQKFRFLWFLWLQFIFHSVAEYHFIKIQMEMNEWTMYKQKKRNVNSLFLYFICSHVILNVYFIIWMQDSTQFLYEWMYIQNYYYDNMQFFKELTTSFSSLSYKYIRWCDFLVGNHLSTAPLYYYVSRDMKINLIHMSFLALYTRILYFYRVARFSPVTVMLFV